MREAINNLSPRRLLLRSRTATPNYHRQLQNTVTSALQTWEDNHKELFRFSATYNVLYFYVNLLSQLGIYRLPTWLKPGT